MIRGPNGVGKSTLLRALAGLVPVSGGDAELQGISLVSDNSLFQEQVAYAGHSDELKPSLPVERNLAIWAELFGSSQAGVPDAMAFFELTQIADRVVAECSAGQKRRLGLARLLVIDRSLWLLDEPTVSLDTNSAGKVGEMVRRHCAAGGTALVATHIALDCGPGPAIDLSPIADHSPAAQDAFLDGDWS